MKPIITSLIIIALSTDNICFAQQGKVVEDFKPSEVNQLGKLYPQVNSDRCVRASISAPKANKVQLDIGGVKYHMVKDTNGVWTGESAPHEWLTWRRSLNQYAQLLFNK